MIDRAPQRLPSQRKVRSVQLVPCIGERAVAAREGAAEIDIGGLAEIVVEAQMTNRGKVAALVGAEQALGVAAENLGRTFEEDPLGRRQNATERQAGVVNAVFTIHQILIDQR